MSASNTLHPETESEFIAFSATIKGEQVRIVVPLKEMSITSRDNQDSFDVEQWAHKLGNIEYEDIY